MVGLLGIVLIAVGGWLILFSGNPEQSQVVSELEELVEEANTDATGSGSSDADVSAAGGSDVGASETAEVTTDVPASTETTNSAEEAETNDEADVDSETPTTDAVTTTSEAAATTSEAVTTTSGEAVATTAAPTTSEAAATTTPPTTSTTTEPAEPPTDTPRVASFEILETLPHDTSAFTQGFEISNGRLFESTGLFDRSSIRELDLATGEIIRNVAVPELFAEGLTIVGDDVIQLTWRAGQAFRYDLDTFQIEETYTYEGEGWGLCLASQGSGNLVMSDGSSQLEFRNPDTFESLGFVDVTFNGSPIENINELECVGDTVWANIWLTSLIIEIDPATGDVITVLDIDELRPESTRNDSGAVWNGIAFDEASNNFLLTGKNWPTIYRVNIG